ncbi:hypothetical protein HC723_11765 [Vibrio sp. S11_S32]|uniref:hypothetical protein n=1 Tax=Vibrio sp. S11_S32 TaxID=2720225 RepID=UPI0016801DDF|nr:hypothetical protein [Vibrio sp. S11_S32]MBD1577109.1 hypothetical protein [Vibrio sp. S11_S32]
MESKQLNVMTPSKRINLVFTVLALLVSSYFFNLSYIQSMRMKGLIVCIAMMLFLMNLCGVLALLLTRAVQQLTAYIEKEMDTVPTVDSKHWSIQFNYTVVKTALLFSCASGIYIYAYLEDHNHNLLSVLSVVLTLFCILFVFTFNNAVALAKKESSWKGWGIGCGILIGLSLIS